MPSAIYRVKNKRRVPSVTTISGLYGDKSGLLYWANQQGLDGRTLDESREAVATPGSIAHDMVDKHIKGLEFDLTPWRPKFSSEDAYKAAIEKASTAFVAFQSWAAFTGFKLKVGEVPLVSEQYEYGGTLDAVMTGKGLALADWKTGKGLTIYPDFLYQIAAYGVLWEENFPDNPITDGFHIIRFSSETADFGHFHFRELDDARQGFLLLREMYEINKRVKRRL